MTINYQFPCNIFQLRRRIREWEWMMIASNDNKRAKKKRDGKSSKNLWEVTDGEDGVNWGRSQVELIEFLSWIRPEWKRIKSPSQQLADLSLFMQQYPLSLWIQFCHTLRCRPRKENFISLLYFYKIFQKKEKNIISVSLIKLQMAQAEDIKKTTTERNWTIDFCLLPPKLFRLFFHSRKSDVAG